MAGGTRPAQAKPPAKGKSHGWQAALGAAVLLGAVGLCVVGAVSGGSDDLSVPAPATDERTDTVPILRDAFASQGICYGWRLTDGYDVVSVGSNLGDGTAVGDAPGCPRWIEVSADITYTSESSEANDSAWIRVRGSDDLGLADLQAVETGLGRFELDEDAFVDDPGWAITRAATTLPLLAAEAGLAGPAATPSADPAAPASPLPSAGDDFWRDRWGWLLAAVALLLLAALFITVGVVQRRRTTAPGRGAATDAPSRSGRKLRSRTPAQRAGAEAAGRTREKA
ncbi:hypothetical protein [Micromonospora sp. NPDC047738]|uniref:hypothetical protein n=1 Tax=unclassified Micromonospora TaxID=2617518 RepID=UPI0033CCB570